MCIIVILYDVTYAKFVLESVLRLILRVQVYARTRATGEGMFSLDYTHTRLIVFFSIGIADKSALLSPHISV